MDWEKIFANDMTDKEFISNIYITTHTTQHQKNKQPNLKMGRKTKDTFFQRGNASGQCTHEQMPNIVNHDGNASQNYNEISPHICQNMSSKRKQITNTGENVAKRESSCTVGGNVN